MSEENDSWFKQAFGVDLGEAAAKVEAEVTAEFNQVLGGVERVVQEVRQEAEPALDAATRGATGIVKQVADAVTTAGGPAAGPVQAAADALDASDGTVAAETAAVGGADSGAVADAANVGDAGDAGAADGGGESGSAPDPTFVDIDRPFSVLADNPIEFVNKGNEFLGQGIAGHMTTEPLSADNAETDAAGRVARSNLTVKTTTRRPHWTGGRPIGDEKAVIEQAEELIRAHEERHREIMKNGMRNAAAEMRGKPKSKADAILVKWIAQVDKEQDALDAREGQIQVIQSGGRITGTRLVPR